MTTTPKRRSDDDPADLLDPDVVQVLRHAFADIAEAPAEGVPTGRASLVAVEGTRRPAPSPRRRRVTAFLAAAGTGTVAAGVAGALALSGALLPAPTAPAGAAGTPTADTFADLCEKRLAEGTGPKTLPRYISHLLLAEKKALVAYAGKDDPGVVCVLRKQGEEWTALDVHVNPTPPIDADKLVNLEKDDGTRVDADGLGFAQVIGHVPPSVDTMALETKGGDSAPITVKDGRFLTLLLSEPGTTGKMWRVVAYSKGVRLDRQLGAIGTAEVSPDGVQQPIEGADDVPDGGEETQNGPDKTSEDGEKSPEDGEQSPTS